VCRGCEVTADVDGAVAQRPCLTPSDTYRFVLHDKRPRSPSGGSAPPTSLAWKTPHPARPAGRTNRNRTP